MQGSNDTEKDQKPKTVNIATMVRVRPLLKSQQDYKQSISCKDQKTLQIQLSGEKRKQTLDKLFSPQSTQRQLFQAVEPIIAKCGLGYNVTIFTYGQTGSGKTHTMFGSDWNNIIKKSLDKNGIQKKQAQSTFLRSIEQDQNHSGLIPRSIHYLFNNLITKRKKFIKVYCSFLQLYNQTMLDLLQDDAKAAKQKKMFIHQNQNDGIYVQGLNQMVVQDVDQCLQLMKMGQKNRVVRQTSMNIKSSRSHTIFQLLIQEVFPAKKSYRRMKLNLCDLAGSQKINKSQKMQSGHLEELKNINLSLTTLGKVISCLSQKSKPPYRQSKITRLLQDSLGGNTFTVIIATITTKSTCLDESINTLKFLQRAKQIKSQIVSKQINDNPQMRNLQKQIAYLKDVLKMKRNGTSVIDVQLNQKLKRLQSQNIKLKELVDQDLIQKLVKQNTHLKIQLQKKTNDNLSQSFNKSGGNFVSIASSYNKKFIAKQHKTLQQQTHINERVTSKQDEIQSDYRTSMFNNVKKSMQTKSFTYGRSTDGTSSNNGSKKITSFPSLSRKTTSQNANKILDRIQQIQKVKIANRMKLQKQLQIMQKNKNQKYPMGSNQNFGRSSKYSNNKYRY